MASKSQTEAARISKCISHYLDTLNFHERLSHMDTNVARAVTRAFIMIDSEHPELKVEVMNEGRHRFTLTFSGFNTEIDLETTYDNFLNESSRDPGFMCIRSLAWNPKSATITAEVDSAAAGGGGGGGGGGGAPAMGGRRKLGRDSHYDDDELAIRAAPAAQRYRSGGLARKAVAVGGAIRVNAAAELDMGRVEDSHRAGIAEVGVRMLYYDQVMPRVEKKPLVVPTENFYKLIFWDFNKEFDVATLYRRTLGGPGQRDSAFSMVRNVGFDPRIKALVLRTGKRQIVNEVPQERY